ncbi:DUF7146 domain-containing protein [Methylocella tundrae]|nr:hypothetical protein [Methylocella tundrae]
MARLSRDDLAQVKALNPLDDIIDQRTKLKRANSRGIREGQCICNPVRGKWPLWVNAQTSTWGCLARGSVCGGDTFTFLEQFDGLDFQAALASMCGAEAVRDPEAAAKMEAERAARGAEHDARAKALAEDERAKAYAIWQNAGPVAETLVDAYFAHRGLDPVRSKALRFSAAEPYWHAPEDAGAKPSIVHRGPCMLAAIQGPDGRFLGLHRTWLDPRLGTAEMPREASGKAEILAADGAPLPAKKMRGGKQGGAIRLHDWHEGSGERVFLCGEGIETVETVYLAVHRGFGVNYCAWAAGDLGNISGKALGLSSRHPTKPGRWIPSEEPDPDAPGLMPPAGAAKAIILGDGDSDPLVTMARLECARRRWSRAGCPTEVRMAPEGSDYNDLARGQIEGMGQP